MCRGKTLWRQPSRPPSQALFHDIAFSFLLAFLPLLVLLLLLRVVDADGELAGLGAVLVLDQEGVLARVSRGDGGDCDAGKLAVLVLERVALARYQRLVVPRPAHLGRRLAPHIAGQVQGLKRTRGLQGFNVCRANLDDTEFRGKRRSKSMRQ